MKKGIALCLTMLLALTLCSCGGQPKESPESTSCTESVVSSTIPVQESSEQSVTKPASSKATSSEKETSRRQASSASETSSKESSAEEISEEKSIEEKSDEPSVDESSVLAENSEESAEEISEESGEESIEESSEESAEESVEETSEESTGESREISEESSEQEESQYTPTPVISGETVDASWFDDAVFVGDSVTLKLSYYADYGSLGNADFLCAGSLGYNNAQWGYDHPDNVHPVYNGIKYTVEDGVAMLQPKKIFIMLGMNDIGLYGVDGAVEGMKSLTAKIQQRCPDTVIYVQSVTPMLSYKQLSDLNNTTIAAFDQAIQPICQERGYIYLDVASAVNDGYGNLMEAYCSDATAMGLHFSDAGCEAWVNYLKSHVA